MPADATAGFSAEERAAMKEYVRERKAASRRGKTQSAEDAQREVLAKIAEMPEPDRAMAERIDAIVTTAAPHLVPRTWYGMPAYSKDGNVVCFFQPASKFKERYSTLGFSDKANLDERHDVAELLRAHGVHRDRRGKGSRARKEGCELRASAGRVIWSPQ
jgi:hypothetical protein